MEHNEVYLTRIRELKKRFGFDFVGIATVLNANHSLLTWMHATGYLNKRYRQIVLESGKGIAGGVHRTKRAMLIQNAPREIPSERTIEFPIIISEQLVSMFALPLWKQETVQGVLLLAFRSPNRINEVLFSQTMEELGPAFCDFAILPESYEEAVHGGIGMSAESVPVYELMSYHILRAEEEERRRISRDIHDGVVQELLGLQMLLRSVKYQKDLESVMNLIVQVDSGLNAVQNELRSILTGLRPVILDDFGLVAALRSHFKWLGESHGAVVHFLQNIDGTRYSPEKESVFYRNCQEALLNACKYSGSGEISVSLTESEGYLTLEVTDHGVGFDPNCLEIKGSGMGFPGMADRAELIDGELTVQSAPGKGTSVWLTAKVKEGGET